MIEQQSPMAMHSDASFSDDPPSSPVFRTPSKRDRARDSESHTGERDRSVVDSVVSDRRERSMNAGRYNKLSSPLANLHHKEAQTRKLNDARSSRAQQKAMERRGGLEKMESLVMNSEKADEAEAMRRDAAENAIPAELASDLEREQQDEMELHDEDLMNFIERRDEWERELEEMMADFSVK